MNHQLTFYLYRAKEDIDWSSPGSVIRTLVRNKLKNDRFFMSHIDVGLTTPEEVKFKTGMRRVSSFNFYRKLLSGHYGMELITGVFPGQLIPEARVIDNISYARKHDKFRSINFLINEKTSIRLFEFFNEYNKRNYPERYSGFTSNPFRGEGAGCVAYALSYLKVAGILNEEYIEAWSRKLKVPRKLFKQENSPEFIGIWGYLRGKNGEWTSANSDEPSKNLTVFDPLLIYLWVQSQTKNESITLDYRNHQPPEDNYWDYDWY
jgi:hypothetical protein